MTLVNEDDREIGKLIEYHRLARGISRSQLAKELDLSPQQIGKYEQGKNRVSIKMGRKIANILKFNFGEFALEDKEDYSSYTRNHATLELVRNFNTLSYDMQDGVLNFVKKLCK